MVRRAQDKDLPRIMELVDAARTVMRESGNMNQWVNGYPDEAAILRDIASGAGFMIGDHGYFAMYPSPDPTYSEIEGEWLDDSPYVVLHRIASTPESHGVFLEAVNFAFGYSKSIRIDTHEDNRIMRHLVGKAGFSYCGVIHLLNGDPRLAFQKNI